MGSIYMSKIKRDVGLVVEFKRGRGVDQLALKHKLKITTVERIIRHWLNDIALAANRSYKTEAITKYGLPWIRIRRITK